MGAIWSNCRSLHILLSITSLIKVIQSKSDYINQTLISLPHFPDYKLQFEDDAHSCAIDRNPFKNSVFIKVVRTEIYMDYLKNGEPNYMYKPSSSYNYDIKTNIKTSLLTTFNFYVESRSEIPYKTVKGVKRDSYYLNQNALKISFDINAIHNLQVETVEILVHGQGRIGNKKKNYKAKLLFKFFFVLHPNRTLSDIEPLLDFAPPWSLSHPVITLQIFEEPLIGSTVYMANAFVNFFDGYTPLIIYRIVQNHLNFFTIDELTGEITVAKLIDIEKIYPNTSFEVRVEARIYEKTVYNIKPIILVLNITVYDINDNPPIIHKEYRFSILENATYPFQIAQFTTLDADVTKPAIHHFKINTKFGGNDDNFANFEFISPLQASNMKDVKDVKPLSGEELLKYKNSEDFDEDYALDAENGGDKFVKSELSRGDSQALKLSETNNVLVLSRSARLDREKRDKYNFLVTITDMTPDSLPNKSTTTEKKSNTQVKEKVYFYTKILIVIDVLDVNDNLPICHIDKKVMTVSDDIEIGTPIGILLGQDADDPKTPNGQIHYFLNSVNKDTDVISIEQELGIISIKSSLAEFPDISVKRYSYRACNLGAQFLNICCHGDFVLKVRNYQRINGLKNGEKYSKDNQNEIMMYKPEGIYDVVEIPEDIPLGSRVYEIKAKVHNINGRERWRRPSLATTTDYTWQNNRRHQIYYKLEPIPLAPQDYLSFFVHPKTGIIYTKSIMNAERKRVYNIKVKASTGDLVKRETKLLTIRIRDINDISPIFLNKSSMDPVVLEVKRDSELGTKVGQLKAWDGDVDDKNSKIFYHTMFDSSDGKIKLDKETGYVYVNGNLSNSHITALTPTDNSYALIIKVTNSKTYAPANIRYLKMPYNTADPTTIRVRIELIDDYKKMERDPQFIKLHTKHYNYEIPPVDPTMPQSINGLSFGIPIGSIIKGALEDVNLMEQSFCRPNPNERPELIDSSGENVQECNAVSWMIHETDLTDSIPGLTFPEVPKNNMLYFRPRSGIGKEQRLLTGATVELVDPIMPYINGYLKLKVAATKKRRKDSLKMELSMIDITAYYLWDSYKSKFILETNPERSQKSLDDIKNYFNTEMRGQNLEIRIDSLNYFMKNDGVLSLNYTEACFHVIRNGMVLEPGETQRLITNNRRLWNYVQKKKVTKIEKCHTESLYRKNPMEIILFGLTIILFLSMNLLNLILFFYKKKIVYYTKDDLSLNYNPSNILGERAKLEDYFGNDRCHESLGGSRDSKALDYYEWQEKSMDMIEVGSYKDKNDFKIDSTYYEISKIV